MKYTMNIESKDASNWKLMRYDQLAGTETEKPGSFDNAHLEFWVEILDLREKIKTITDAKTKDELYAAADELRGTPKEKPGLFDAFRDSTIMESLAETHPCNGCYADCDGCRHNEIIVKDPTITEVLLENRELLKRLAESRDDASRLRFPDRSGQ